MLKVKPWLPFLEGIEQSFSQPTTVDLSPLTLIYNRQRMYESLGYHTPAAYDSIKRVA